MDVKNVCVLGATGSIGLNTLDVISQHSHRYYAFALTAYNNDSGMLALCLQYQPKFAVMVDEDAAERLSVALLNSGLDITVLSGALALEEVSAHDDVPDIIKEARKKAGVEEISQ